MPAGDYISLWVPLNTVGGDTRLVRTAYNLRMGGANLEAVADPMSKRRPPSAATLRRGSKGVMLGLVIQQGVGPIAHTAGRYSHGRWQQDRLQGFNAEDRATLSALMPGVSWNRWYDAVLKWSRL